MLYEMLCGRRPFTAVDPDGYREVIAQANIAALPAQVPEGLGALVMRCLNKVPRKRFSTFTDVLSHIMTLCEAQGVAVQLTDTRGAGDGTSAPDSGYWNSRGYAFAQSIQFEKAVQYYERGLAVLAQEPRSENVMVTPGVDKKTNASDAMCAVLHANLGAVLMRMGRTNEARAAFESALAAVPDDGVSCFRLGLIALHEGRIAEGLALIRKSTECEPGNADLLLKYLRACLWRAGMSSRETEASTSFLPPKRRTDHSWSLQGACLTTNSALNRHCAVLTLHWRLTKIWQLPVTTRALHCSAPASPNWLAPYREACRQ